MSLMCLFPWLDFCIGIVDFENFDFWVDQPIFTSMSSGLTGQNGLSCNNEVSIHDHKIFKNGRKIKIFSFSERYTSKLSVGGF